MFPCEAKEFEIRNGENFRGSNRYSHKTGCGDTADAPAAFAQWPDVPASGNAAALARRLPNRNYADLQRLGFLSQEDQATLLP